MTFKKGQSGNPKGRPKLGDSAGEALDLAIKAVQQKKKKNLLNHFVRRAFENDAVLIALIKKKIPDMQFIKTDESLSQSFEKLANRIAKALILSEKAQNGKTE